MIFTDSQPESFLTVFTNEDQVACADVTVERGGKGHGFRPHELLEAALATCMNITLRMAAQKHDIPLVSASVVVSLNRGGPGHPIFVCRVQLHGDLSEAHKNSLLSSIEQSPVRTTLSRGFQFRVTAD